MVQTYTAPTTLSDPKLAPGDFVGGRRREHSECNPARETTFRAAGFRSAPPRTSPTFPCSELRGYMMRGSRDQLSILLAVRHPLFLRGLRDLLARQNDICVVASCSDGFEALANARA